MKQWMPTDMSEPFFGLRRIMDLEHKGLKIMADSFVSDYRSRSFAERWFTFPWRPFQRTKLEPIAYVMWNKVVIVSPRTFRQLEEAL